MIVSTEKLPKRALRALDAWEVHDGSTSSELVDAEVIMSWSNILSKVNMNNTPKLRAVQFFSAGVDDIDYSKIPKNIRMFSNADGYSVSVAEHAWALILALARNLCNGEKKHCTTLSKKTFLLLGCGGIGSQIAKMGRGFDMRTIGLSRSFKNPEYFDERHSDPGELNHLLTEADIVGCALPANRSTRGLLDQKKLELTKPNCIIVNVGRAEVIEKDAILKLLKERPETKFGTDVFWRKDGKEIFESKLWDLDNFIGTRHTGGAQANRDVFEDALFHAAENIATFLRTGDAKNEIKVSDYL